MKEDKIKEAPIRTIEVSRIVEEEPTPKKTRRGKLEPVIPEDMARDIEKNPDKYKGWML